MDVGSDAPRAFRELDDNLRPTMDREVRPQDEAAAEPQRTLTYDELRQRNRQEYERSMALGPNSPFRQKPFPPPAPQPQAPPTDATGPAPAWDQPPPRPA